MARWCDPDVQLLRALREAGEDGISPEDLGEAGAGLERLRDAGYEFSGPPTSERYRITSAPPRLIADDMRAASPEEVVIGSEILVFEETDSTNDLAARAGRDGLPEGVVIFAESQRAGRGRLGRKWVSPPVRNLLFSVLLRPNADRERWADLTFCAALAVAEVAEQFTGKAARIKWPNDVLVDGRKIAGILLEAHQGESLGFVVVGIGVNVLQTLEDFPPELRERAGSLAMLCREEHRALERREVAAAILARLDSWYADWPMNSERIRQRCAEFGCATPQDH